MGPLSNRPRIDTRDPRLQPGAYITNGIRLVEVGVMQGMTVPIVNCLNEVRSSIGPDALLRDWKLVKAAPVVPDTAAT